MEVEGWDQSHKPAKLRKHNTTTSQVATQNRFKPLQATGGDISYELNTNNSKPPPDQQQISLTRTLSAVCQDKLTITH